MVLTRLRLLRAVVFISSLALHCNAAKILLLPQTSKSHTMEQARIGSQLHLNGHTVYILLSNKWEPPAFVEQSGLEIIRYQADEPPVTETDEWSKEFVDVHMNSKASLGILGAHIQDFARECQYILSDTNLLNHLKTLRIDLALVDGLPFYNCIYILPYKLSIPYATMTVTPSVLNTGVPCLPSFCPYISFGKPMTERMTFTERVSNTGGMFTMTLIEMYSSYLTWYMVEKHLPKDRQISVRAMQAKTQLWLVDRELMLDYPTPSMPHVVQVGGLSTSPSKPLPAELESMASNAKHGIIVVSFGTFASHLADDINARLLASFRRLKYVVIWGYTGPVMEDVPDNVKMIKWIPQNDLLGHKNTKLFITHCGANGQSEALYHGVPMIGFPIQPEQQYNAARIQYKGYGIHMDLKSFMPEDLIQNVEHIFSNSTYKETIEKASIIFQSWPMSPKERAAYWLEHVMKYGSDHLKSHALEMPFYQYAMFDILAFFILVTVLITFVFLKLLRLCCCRKAPKEKTS